MGEQPAPHSYSYNTTPTAWSSTCSEIECRGALLSSDVETRGLPPPPHHLVCVEKFTLPYLTLRLWPHKRKNVYGFTLVFTFTGGSARRAPIGPRPGRHHPACGKNRRRICEATQPHRSPQSPPHSEHQRRPCALPTHLRTCRLLPRKAVKYTEARRPSTAPWSEGFDVGGRPSSP